MENSKKLLYITDQNEYMDNSFIAPLFRIYLKKYMHVDIVYFTEFKSDFEHKDTQHFIVPSRYKNILLNELHSNNVKLETYDFVMVRNNIEILEQVLKDRERYGYKALFRFSYPKRSIKIFYDEAEDKGNILAPVIHHFKTSAETSIINDCDAFLPTSHAMHKEFRSDVSIPTILCPPAINPAMLYENEQHSNDEKIFVYAGTLDRLREFETVLEAFSHLKSKKWKLLLSTRDTDYAKEMLEKYPQIQKQIELFNAQTKEGMLELIAKSDIGVALLPNIPIYTTSTSVKVFDYYTSCVPCLMTNSEHTASIFTDRLDAWFCNFTQEEITQKLEYLLTLSKDEVTQVGEKGQQRLLDIRNYEIISKDIAVQLNAL